MTHLFDSAESQNGVFSGAVQNCYTRLNTIPETAQLEFFFPKNTDEDRFELKDILNEPYIIKKEWIDSGLRLYLKGLPAKKIIPSAEQIDFS